MTEENINIDGIIRNTRRYWYVDGLTEIAGGLVIFLTGLSYWLVASMQNNGVKYILLILAQPAVIIIGSYLARKIVPIIKAKLTYPRTGYLVFRKPMKKRRFQRFFFVGLTAAIISALAAMFSSTLPDRLLPFLSSIFLAIFSLYLGYQNAVPRFYWIGLILLILGSAISFLNPQGPLPYVMLFSGMGIVWVLSGAITLTLYLHKTRPIMEES
jgi:MFS family permease